MFIKKYALLLTMIIAFSTKGFSSDTSRLMLKKNIGFVTFGSEENRGSINYERIFKTSRKLYWSYSIGVQPFTLADKFSVPASINAFTKGSLHHFEIDVTATFFMNKYHPFNGGWKEDFNKQLYLSPFVCYRLQKNSGIVLKTGIGPHFVLDPPSSNVAKLRTRFINPSVFASLGISF